MTQYRHMRIENFTIKWGTFARKSFVKNDETHMAYLLGLHCPGFLCYTLLGAKFWANRTLYCEERDKRRRYTTFRR